MATIQDLGKVAYFNKGAYNSEITYEINDVVSYNGSSYVSLGNENRGNLPTNTNYWSVVAEKGEKGDTGKPFVIEKTYTSIEDMVDDYDNMNVNDYVMIQGNIEEEENATLWTKTDVEVSPYKWVYLADFSGASGITGQTPNIQIGTVTEGNAPSVTRRSGSSNENPILDFVLKTGPKGETGATGNGIQSNVKTSTVGLVDTYTITYTNGTTTTFDVTNGEDGEVTQEQLDETNENVDWLQTLVNQMPTVSGQGTDLSLQDVLNYRLMKFLPQGVSGQFSTTGKNLLPNNATSQAPYGVTVTKNSDGSVTLDGTSTNPFNIVLTTDLSVNAGQYTMSLRNRINGVGIYAYVGGTLTQAVSATADASTIKTTFTLNENTTFNEIRLYIPSGSSFSNLTVYPQIETGVSATSYEPYTDGPAPNSSYPFPVKTVTGENSVVLQNVNSLKNNFVMGSITSYGADSDSDSRARSDYNIVQGNTTYRFSSSNSKIYYVPYFYNSNKTFISYVYNWKPQTTTFTTPVNTKYVRFIFKNNDTDSINLSELTEPMLVKGSTAPTTYVEHEEQTKTLSLGSMELCSTPDGTIRDGIVGTPNNWFKREYIGKVVLDGSEDSWVVSSLVVSGFKSYYISIAPDWQGTNDWPLICSHFKQRPYNDWTTLVADNFVESGGRNVGFRIDESLAGDLTAWKNWLSNNNVKLYYQLKTYQDIPITDTTLINQLNDIYNNAHSYNGVTNITTTYEDGNEQMYLDIEALKNVWNTSL